MNKELQKQEAVRRMKAFKIYNKTIKEFVDEGKINASELEGFLYWVTDKELELIKLFEEKYNVVVYHAIRNNTTFGKMLTLLYVSDSEEEWEMDMQDAIDGFPLAYVYNLDDDLCSEFGSVQVASVNGGLKRIG